MSSNGYAKGGDVRGASYAKGGAVLGRQRDFLKESDGKDQHFFPGKKDTFLNNTENEYGKGDKADISKRTGSKKLATVKPRS